MIRNLHHPSCPAGHTAGAPCICPPAKRSRRRPLTAIAEALCFAAMLGFVAGLPIYLLWRHVA
jgi:hypothetical protein